MNDVLTSVASNQTQRLQKSVEDWVTAEPSSNATFLEPNLTYDFVGVGPYGFLLTKGEWLERHECRKLRYESFRLGEVRVRPYGEVAVIVVRRMTRGRCEDSDLPGSLRTMLYFAEQEGRWLLAGIHMSFIAGLLSEHG